MHTSHVQMLLFLIYFPLLTEAAPVLGIVKAFPRVLDGQVSQWEYISHRQFLPTHTLGTHNFSRESQDRLLPTTFFKGFMVTFGFFVKFLCCFL